MKRTIDLGAGTQYRFFGGGKSHKLLLRQSMYFDKHTMIHVLNQRPDCWAIGYDGHLLSDKKQRIHVTEVDGRKTIIE